MGNVSKTTLNGFKWIKQKQLWKFNEDFIKKHDEDSNIGYFFEVDVEYPKTLFNNHKDLPFLPERQKVEKVVKLICSIEDKGKIYYSHKSFKISIKS